MVAESATRPSVHSVKPSSSPSTTSSMKSHAFVYIHPSNHGLRRLASVRWLSAGEGAAVGEAWDLDGSW